MGKSEKVLQLCRENSIRMIDFKMVDFGLPLALAIVRRHNGDIDVDCGKGGSGATFTIKLYK